MWLYIWLAVLVVTLIVEFITLDLVSIWMSLGAFVAMILAACGVGFEIQIVVAVVIAVGCILGLRKFALKWLNKSKEKTNMDLIIGKRVKLLTKISDDQMGTVKVNGIIYSVKEKDDNEVEENSYVVIEKVEGNKLIVRKEN